MPHLIEQNGVTGLYVYPRASHSQKGEKGFRLVKSTPIKLRVVQLPLRHMGLELPWQSSGYDCASSTRGMSLIPGHRTKTCMWCDAAYNKQTAKFFF